MKGFIHLIEVAIAGMIIILVIPTFFTAQIIKHSWERADLITTANDIIDSLKACGDLEKILNESETINKINKIKPPNIKYSLKIIDAPKQNILVGCCECTDTQLARAKEFLTPVYVNNRWINFTVEKIKIDDIKILTEFNDSTITKDVVFDTASSIVDAWINISKSTNVIEAKMDVSGDLNVGSYPSDIAIDIGNSSVNDFSFTGELNLGNSPKRISDFSSKLNSILQTCSCSGCSLFDNYCTIPINVTSQTEGIVRLSNLFIRPKEYDNILFIDYTNFDENQIIQNYINSGKPVVAVTDIIDVTFDQLNDTFNLTAGSGSGILNFTKFAPQENKIVKYFLGFGFDVSTPNTVDTKKQGNWYIWEESRQVNITVTNMVEVENKTIEEGIINVAEGGSFNLKGPDSNFYTFKVKKIFDMSNVTFQALNTSFVFKDFSDSFKVTGNNVISNPDNTFAAIVANGTAIWISDFPYPYSDEYRTLVKATVAQPQEWYLVENIPERKFIDTSTFVNLCCDMPESIELQFMLWYIY